MNPTATLTEIREIIKDLPNSPTFQDDAGRLAALIEALDNWISKGGFLPDPWTQAYVETIRKVRGSDTLGGCFEG